MKQFAIAYEHCPFLELEYVSFWKSWGLNWYLASRRELQLKAVHLGMGLPLLDDLSCGGRGKPLLFSRFRSRNGVTIVGKLTPVVGRGFRVVRELLMLKDGC